MEHLRSTYQHRWRGRVVALYQTSRRRYFRSRKRVGARQFPVFLIAAQYRRLPVGAARGKIPALRLYAPRKLPFGCEAFFVGTQETTAGRAVAVLNCLRWERFF